MSRRDKGHFYYNINSQLPDCLQYLSISLFHYMQGGHRIHAAKRMDTSATMAPSGSRNLSFRCAVEAVPVHSVGTPRSSISQTMSLQETIFFADLFQKADLEPSSGFGFMVDWFVDLQQDTQSRTPLIRQFYRHSSFHRSIYSADLG